MALLKPGPIGQLSGKLGGIEIALSHGQSVVKHCKSRPPRFSTSRLVSQTSNQAALSFWQALPEANKTAWFFASLTHKVPDRFGTLRQLSGYQLFMSMPRDFRYTLLPLWRENPPAFSLQWPIGLSAHAVAPGHLHIEWTSCASFTSAFVTVWIGRFRPTGRKSRCYTWKMIGMIASIAPDAIFDTALSDDNIILIEGETIAVRSRFWIFDHWPIYCDMGNILVTAP